MSVFALIFSIFCALILVANLPFAGNSTFLLVVQFVVPLLSLVFGVRTYFWVLSAQKGLDVSEYKTMIQQLRQELDTTKKRVIDGDTVVEYPKGYGKGDTMDLPTGQYKFPAGYKKGDEKPE